MLSTFGRNRIIYSMDTVDSILDLPEQHSGSAYTAIWVCLYSISNRHLACISAATL